MAASESKGETEGHAWRKLAAIMFTDIVGYTALTQVDEEQALEVLKRHNRLLRPFFPKYHGREIKTIGDSFLGEFDSALDATLCAVEIQKFLHDYNISTNEDWKIKLRIGIHLGDVVHEGRDIFGDAVNIASRIEPIADAEGICVSQQVFDQIHNKISYPLEQLERTELKNVRFPIKLYSVVMPWKEKTVTKSVELHDAELDKLRVAVLPFSNLSPDPDDEYFADGITEELISTIANINDLQVIARTSVLRYKGGSKAIEEIGKELKAGSILEGSVRKAGEKLRITAQLIDSKDSRHLWSETYDRELKDIFAIQSDVARSVALALKVKLLPLDGREKTLARKEILSTEAHNLYLEGLYQRGFSRGSLERSSDDLRKAIGCFEKALEIDPKFAQAYAGLADCYNTLGGNEFVKPSDAYSKARDFAEKALELDDSVTEAHDSLASVLYVYYWDFSQAEREFKKALELNPSLASARSGYADLLLILGRTAESLRELNRALELNPLSMASRTSLGRLYCLTGRYDEAITECNRILNMDPSHISAYEWPAIAYAEKTMFNEAIESATKFEPLYNGQVAKMCKARIYSMMGRSDEVKRLKDDMIQLSRSEYVTHIVLAVLHKLSGDDDEASRELEAAYNMHSPELIYLRSHKFYFGIFNSDPRFFALLKKIGLISQDESLQAVIEIQRKQNKQNTRTIVFDKKRIAILPFANISPDPNDEYFADGMTEELISKISLISELSVISRTSVIGYKNPQNKRVIDIGSELKVGTLLEGSVRKASTRVRVSIQLIDVETDRHLWSANYDRTLEDIFEIQSEIADNVARELKIRLLEGENARIKKSSTENVEAHILYLKGLALYSKSTKEGLEKSIEIYKQAIEKDPTYATAYAAMADSFIRLGFKELQPSREAFSNAKKFAERALEIDPTLAEAHLSLGSVIRNLEWNYEGAEKEFRKVIELNPNLAEAHSRLAVLLAQEAKFDEAIREVRRALELDPMSADTSSVAGMLYLYSRQYDEAIALLTNATELDPNTAAPHNLGLALVQKGNIEEGIKLIKKAVKTEQSAEDKMELAYAYTRAGNTEEARKILSELLEGSKENPGWAAAIAGVYASLGEKDKAIEWLEIAYEEHSGFLAGHLRADFIFDPLRSDPKFVALLKKIGLE